MYKYGLRLLILHSHDSLRCTIHIGVMAFTLIMAILDMWEIPGGPL